MIHPWLYLILAFAACPGLWSLSKPVCEVRMPSESGNLDKQGWSIRAVCCEGYEGSPGNCRPRCTPHCVNAQCSAPQECTCNDGYETVGGTGSSTVGCQPKCHACRYGDCIAPGICRCWPAFAEQPPLPGCQPLGQHLLDPELCLRRNCSCLQEHFSWTPLLAVAPKCIGICHNSQSKGCLKLDQCMCNSLNHLLVCQGSERKVPQQFSCEVIKEKDRTGQGDPFDRTVSIQHIDRKEESQTTVQISHINRKKQSVHRDREVPTVQIQHIDRKEEVASKDQRDLTVQISHIDRKDQDQTNHTDQIPNIDRKEQVVHRDQTDHTVQVTYKDQKEQDDHTDLIPHIYFKKKVVDRAQNDQSETINQSNQNQTYHTDRVPRTDQKEQAVYRKQTDHTIRFHQTRNVIHRQDRTDRPVLTYQAKRLTWTDRNEKTLRALNKYRSNRKVDQTHSSGPEYQTDYPTETDRSGSTVEVHTVIRTDYLNRRNPTYHTNRTNQSNMSDQIGQMERLHRKQKNPNKQIRRVNRTGLTEQRIQNDVEIYLKRQEEQKSNQSNQINYRIKGKSKQLKQDYENDQRDRSNRKDRQDRTDDQLHETNRFDQAVTMDQDVQMKMRELEKSGRKTILWPILLGCFVVVIILVIVGVAFSLRNKSVPIHPHY